MSFNPEVDSSFVNSQISTSKNYVKFYPKWVRNNFKSKQEGREVGEYKDFVMIVCPGQPKSEVNRPATEKDTQEYPQEWNAYKAGREQRINGTPIESLGLDKGRTDSLKSLHIYSIEQLAELSDLAKQKVGMGANDLQQKAKMFLSSDSEINRMKKENEDLKSVIQDLNKRLEAVEKPKKRGRPRKNVTSDNSPERVQAS